MSASEGERVGEFLNVVDVEATCWEGQPPAGQVNEIIEIGICVVDVRRRERVSKHRILVKPVRSRVSRFCTELTGLTQEEVDGGIDFREACALLDREHRSHFRAWASWGDYDRRQFERQCGPSGVRYPFGSRHTNAKALFSEAHGLRKRLGMSAALAHLAFPLDGRHHSGVDDAWNIGAIIVDLMHREAWPSGQ